MITYLVGYSVVHASGTFVSRAHMRTAKPVTLLTLEQWEHTIAQDYHTLRQTTVRVFSYQEIAP